VTDFLQEKRREISERLRELKPLVEEYHQLEAAAQALAGVNGQAAGSRAAGSRRGPGRPAGSVTRGGKRRGRPRGSGTRAGQALDIVRRQPGVTVTELAEKMGIKQNYLYRVLPTLEGEGQVSKRGRGWYPRPNDSAPGQAETSPAQDAQ